MLETLSHLETDASAQSLTRGALQNGKELHAPKGENGTKWGGGGRLPDCDAGRRRLAVVESSLLSQKGPRAALLAPSPFGAV